MLNDDFVLKKYEKENIERLYHQENMTMVEIGKIYEISAANIGKFILENGIQARHRGKRKELEKC